MIKDLAAFHLGCVQEESLRRLTLSTSRSSPSFAGLDVERERLLHQHVDQLHVSVNRSTRTFLEKASADGGPNTGNSDRLYYGFPTYVDKRRKVAPVFFVDIQVGSTNGGTVTLERPDETRVYVNHHLLRQEELVPEEVAAVQERVEQVQSFSEKLAVFLQYVNVDDRAWESTRLLPDEPMPGVYPSPILFTSSYSPFTYNLERDLVELQRYGFLQRKVDSTALGPILTTSSQSSTRNRDSVLTEVLPLNREQESAVQSARIEALTVITGPPGTGKSQVVVNLLAGAVMDGEPVLFASKNNQAVDVVCDRLREILGEEFDVLLRLGSRRVIEETKADIFDRLSSIADRQDDLKKRFTPEAEQNLRDRTSRVRQQVKRLDDAFDKWKDAGAQRKEAEQQIPEGWARAEPPGSPEAIDQRVWRRLLSRARSLAGETRIGIVLWVKRLFLRARLLETLREEVEALVEWVPPLVRSDIRSEAFSSDGFSDLVAVLQTIGAYREWVAYCAAEADARENLDQHLGPGASYDDERYALKQTLSQAYQDLLRTVWIGDLVRNIDAVRSRSRTYFDAIDGLRSASRSGFKKALNRLESATSALARYLPVWVVTNLSVRNALPLRPTLFDLVIVDEASQCDIASAVPLLYRAKRSAIIGDENQLRHITAIREKDESRIARRSGSEHVLPAWSYVTRSLYDRAEQAAQDRADTAILLRKHYRSHPDIIGFSNEAFYGGRLQLMRKADTFDMPLPWLGFSWVDIRGSVPKTRRSAYNPDEIDAIMAFLAHAVKKNMITPTRNIGVVTPFRVQAERLKDRIQKAPWREELQRAIGMEAAEKLPVTVGTAHTFQGDERDIIVFSPVVASGMKDYTARWVATTNQLLNVAVTRARDGLIVVGDVELCRQVGGALAKLVQHAEMISAIRNEIT